MRQLEIKYPPRLSLIGATLLAAVFLFELFNFDTTYFALSHLLRDQTFSGVSWAAVLAFAICIVDVACLIHLCIINYDEEDYGARLPRSTWLLLSVWAIVATLNALSTWYAISLTLLQHNFGNAILSNEQLIRYVPILVASLVWLTRIPFILAVSLLAKTLIPLLQWSFKLVPQPGEPEVTRPLPQPELLQNSHHTPGTIRMQDTVTMQSYGD